MSEKQTFGGNTLCKHGVVNVVPCGPCEVEKVSAILAALKKTEWLKILGLWICPCCHAAYNVSHFPKPGPHNVGCELHAAILSAEGGMSDQRIRAYFEAAEFENVDKLMGGSIGDFTALGVLVAQRTKALTTERDALKVKVEDLKNEGLKFEVLLDAEAEVTALKERVAELEGSLELAERPLSFELSCQGGKLEHPFQRWDLKVVDYSHSNPSYVLESEELEKHVLALEDRADRAEAEKSVLVEALQQIKVKLDYMPWGSVLCEHIWKLIKGAPGFSDSKSAEALAQVEGGKVGGV